MDFELLASNDRLLSQLQQLPLLSLAEAVPAQKQLGENFVFGVQKGRRNPQRFGELSDRFRAWFVDTALVLVDARTRHIGLHTGQSSKLSLRQTRALAGFSQSPGKDWMRGF